MAFKRLQIGLNLPETSPENPRTSREPPGIYVKVFQKPLYLAGTASEVVNLSETQPAGSRQVQDLWVDYRTLHMCALWAYLTRTGSRARCRCSLLPHSRKSLTCFSLFSGDWEHSAVKQSSRSSSASTLRQPASFCSSSSSSSRFRRTWADILTRECQPPLPAG